MANKVAAAEVISVDRIFLDLDNPRHEPYKNETEVIEYLCREEQVYALAKDIVELGLNPLEMFALIPLPPEKGSREKSYVVAEGNRRMCAIKLLNDPDLAPANLRKDFKKLSEQLHEIAEVLGVEFKSKEQVAIWLERVHGGAQGGVGRKAWSPEQKARHIGDKKNIVAQSVLDYAEENGFISSEDRKGKITTAQRYLGNAILREALGLDSDDPQNIARNKTKHDFDILLKKFVTDLVDGVVHSRSDSAEIKKYSRALAAIDGVSNKRVAPEALSPDGKKPKKRKKKPTKPDKQKHLPYEEEILQKLKAIPSYKLERIYYSVCSITLEQHTPLISVGVWSFFECLTALCGRREGMSFADYLSKDKLTKLGFTEKEEIKTIGQTLRRIVEYGNTTKHHKKSAHFNGPQLANDMELLKDLICKLADEVKGKG